jgi:hypothetical protein
MEMMINTRGFEGVVLWNFFKFGIVEEIGHFCGVVKEWLWKWVLICIGTLDEFYFLAYRG